MQRVGLVQALVGGVEAVRVLHLELAAAQHAGAGAGLVAVLGLDLVEDHRQVLVGRALVLDREGEDLLVGGAEEVVGALAVLEAEEQVAVLLPAAAGLVGLLGQQGRQQDLLAADGVHLLADDAGDVLQDLLAQRQPRPDAGGGAADVPGADEQLVAGGLGVGRVVAQRLDHQAGHALDLCGVGHGSFSCVRKVTPWRLAEGCGARKCVSAALCLGPRFGLSRRGGVPPFRPSAALCLGTRLRLSRRCACGGPGPLRGAVGEVTGRRGRGVGLLRFTSHTPAPPARHLPLWVVEREKRGAQRFSGRGAPITAYGVGALGKRTRRARSW